MNIPIRLLKTALIGWEEELESNRIFFSGCELETDAIRTFSECNRHIIELKQAIKILNENNMDETQQYSKSFPPILKPVKFTNSKEQRENMIYGHYLVIRKDGKCHKEIWNGTQWVYNNTEIEYFYLPKLY